MSYSNTVCRKCEKNTYTNLEDTGYLCATCVNEISNDSKSYSINIRENKNNDGIIHKNITWNQSWLTTGSLTSNSIRLYWRSPKYKDELYKIENYLLTLDPDYRRKIIRGNKLDYFLEGLTPGTKYSIELNALNSDGLLVKQTLKKTFTTANI
tara:strand:+ start:2571 stop:3029 length:459 start_codon:yes stop_codon:yes gene_type:complete